jgi:hypothetical protein
MYAILAFLILFLTYEVYKLVSMPAQMAVLGDLERMSRTTNAMEKRVLTNKAARSFRHKATLVLEFGYIFFCFILIFTKAWIVALAILLLMLLKWPAEKMGLSKQGLWIVDGIATITLLLIGLFIYL